MNPRRTRPAIAYDTIRERRFYAPSRRAVTSAALAVVTALLLAACGKESSVPQPATSRGNAPGTPAVLLGDVSRIDSLLAADRGKWVLLNVWATWCKPCVAETPALVRLASSLQDRAFAVVGISMDFAIAPSESAATATVAKFVTRQRVSYPNIIYNGSIDAITDRFSLGGAIPVSILFDPQGHEVQRWEGMLETSEFDAIKSKVS